jgi:hypothetical protein
LIFLLFQQGQNQNGPFSGEGIFVTLVIMFGLALFLLKLGLYLTKAEVRTGFKWVLVSFGLQVGIFFFVGGPLMLLGFAGMMEGGPPAMLIIIFIVLALFIGVNFLNVMHQLGIKRALIVFLMIVIPFLVVDVILIMLITQ